MLRPVRPMLASPGSSLGAALADLGEDVTVEHKLDGARIQVHRDGDVVRVWTRSLREITDGVPEIVARVRSLPCRTAVLDGETLALDDEVGIALRDALPEDELPQSVTFADGSPIPAEYVTQVRDRGLAHAVDVDWQEGDLLVVDNVLVAHGRRPFTGPRRVLVAMSA